MKGGQTTIDHNNLFSVIIGNLDIECVAVIEAKANPPLVIDADALLPAAIMTQTFQAVRRWHLPPKLKRYASPRTPSTPPSASPIPGAAAQLISPSSLVGEINR